MKRLERHDKLYGCVLVRGRWETYGLYIDLGTPPRAYLTVEGRNRYYLGLKYSGRRWEGRVLLGISHDEYADSEKPLSEDLLAGYDYSKSQLPEAQSVMLTLGERWVAENDGGVNQETYLFEEWQKVQPKPLPPKKDEEDE
jgi:hypothetical protein